MALILLIWYLKSINFHVSRGVALTEEMIPMREGVFKNRPTAGGKKEG